MNYVEVLRIVAVPLTSAFIGWFTTVLAIKMIFRPRRPWGFWGIKIQGMVPKRHHELARSIGFTVEEHLISRADIVAILDRGDMQEKMDELIRERISEFLNTRLRLSNPILGALISGSLRKKVEGLLLEEVRRLVPELSGQMMEKLEVELNFQTIVEERVRNFDLDKLEAIIFEISAREFRAIELLCGVLGFAIGLVQVGFLFI